MMTTMVTMVNDYVDVHHHDSDDDSNNKHYNDKNQSHEFLWIWSPKNSQSINSMSTVDT